MGVVDADEGEDLVVFDTDLGQPLVKVTLHPSFVPVFARVSGTIAGNGEAEYFPFVKGDEVIVALPEGNERAGAVIIGRLNNAIDKFPMESVAGQDPTTNSFAFERRRTPKVQEFAGPWMVRAGIIGNQGSLFSIDQNGVVTVKDRENSTMQISPDVIGFQGPSTPESPPKFVLQLDLTGKHFLVQVEDAILSLSASTASPEQNMIGVPGPLAIAAGGNPPLEHALSTEAFFNLLNQLFLQLNVLLSPVGTPLTGTALAAIIVTWLNTNFVAAIQAAGATPLLPQISSALVAAFAAATPKPQTPSGQLRPGLGAPGLYIG